MKLTLRIFFHQFYWSVIFGIVLGIFGISFSIIRIANFYISEGTTKQTDIYSFTISSSPEKSLDDDTLTLFKNIEGVGAVLPYFSPKEQIEAGISYLGFTSSYPIKLKGIPLAEGLSNISAQQNNIWNSTRLDQIAVLLPEQAVVLYNNIAPQRGWPNLEKQSFIGIPGTFLTILDKKINATIVGFNPDEFGNIVTVPAETLFAIYEQAGTNPSYDYFIINSVDNLNRQQIRKLINDLKNLGYDLEESKKDSFQLGLFTRIKYTVGLLGFAILFAFIILKFISFTRLLSTKRQRMWFHRIWGIPDFLLGSIIISTFIFSILCGILSWIVSFFAVVPAQEYIINALSTIGFNTPPIITTAQTALETAIFGLILFGIISIIGTIWFYQNIPKADYIDKF